MASAPDGALRKERGQLLAGAELPLHAEGDEQARGRQLAPDGVGFLCKGRLDLGGGGVLRQPLLGKLDDLRLAAAGEAL